MLDWPPQLHAQFGEHASVPSLPQTSCFENTIVTTMNFFKDAFDKLDEIGQEVGKHAGYAVADITRALESAGQDVSKHIDPSTLKAIEEFGKEAGSYVGATAEDIWKALLGAGEDAGKQIQPIIREIGKSLAEGGEGVRDYFLGVIAEASMIEWADMPTHIQQWIAEHPERIIGIILGILAGPLATAAVPLVLGAFGFTAGGIAAGTLYLIWPCDTTNLSRFHRSRHSIGYRRCRGPQPVRYADERRCWRCRSCCCPVYGRDFSWHGWHGWCCCSCTRGNEIGSREGCGWERAVRQKDMRGGSDLVKVWNLYWHESYLSFSCHFS
jgi:hypothetical protein